MKLLVIIGYFPVLLVTLVSCSFAWEKEFRDVEFKQRSAYQDSDFNNLVLYWGQGNKREQRLSYYCQQPGVSIITLGFINDFTGGNMNTPIINLSDHCEDVENCPQVGQDIAFCQQRGVKILMSLGGANGPYRRQKWEPDTLAWALWNKFLGGTDQAMTRPFGDVIVDGIDFDPEGINNGDGFDKLVHDLRVLSQLQVPARKFLITAAPQCPDLDYRKKNAMYNILHPNPQYTQAYLDMVFVQFYNNYCSASEYATFDRNSSRSFNFDVWNTWAEKTTRSTKIYLGILGKNGHHDSGYVQFEELTKIMDNVHRYSRFGGVMIWDALFAYSNPIFNGDQYGNATSQYLTRLAQPPPVLRLDNTMPLLLPLGHNLYNSNIPNDSNLIELNDKAGLSEMLTPFSCSNGQGFVLLNSIVLRNLLEHIRVGSQQPNVRDPMFKEEDIDSILTKGSYICLGPTSSDGQSGGFGLNYIFNATVATIDDQRLQFSLSTIE